MGSADGYEGFSGVVSLYEGDRELEASCAGFADRPNARPNDADTVFGMASGCKVFTAAGILELVDSGALGLDDPASRFLGGGRLGDGVTVRRLLTHSSGIADYFDEEAGGDYEDLWRELPCYRMRRPEDFLPLFIGREPKFEPGSRFAYSNAGFVLLAYLIERAADRPFPEFMREKVFGPCGMARTGYYRLDMPPPNAAIGYIAEGGSFRSNQYSIPLVGGGDGGCFTNGRDMALFWRAHLGGPPPRARDGGADARGTSRGHGRGRPLRPRRLDRRGRTTPSPSWWAPILASASSRSTTGRADGRSR